jgi:putative hydrolase of the HAD superfamily
MRARHGLKVGVVNNEARELNANRIQMFKLDGFVDFFISSCCVHLRKPDSPIPATARAWWQCVTANPGTQA